MFIDAINKVDKLRNVEEEYREFGMILWVDGQNIAKLLELLYQTAKSLDYRHYTDIYICCVQKVDPHQTNSW